MNNAALVVLIISFFVSFIGLIIGTILDLKTREIPDLLNFGLLAIGFGISIFASLIFSDISFFVSSLFGFLFCFLFSCIMFYTGQWGGGDAKMLMALGVLLGLSVSDILSLSSFSFFSIPLVSSFSSFITSLPFLLVFLVLVFFMGGLYGLVWLLVLLVVYRKTFFPKYISYLSSQKKQQLLVWVSCVLFFVFSFFFFDALLRLAVFLCLLLILIFFYSYPFLKILEEIAFVKEIPVEKVTQGDWIVADIVVSGEVVARKKDFGISAEQLQRLLVLAHKGKIKKVKVKYGIPFVPSFLMAFVVVVWLFFF